LRGHFTQRTMKRINMAIGVIILIFAAVGIFSSASTLVAAPVYPVASHERICNADFRVADTAMKGWNADFPCEGGSSLRLYVKPVSKMDPFGDSSVEMLSVAVIEYPAGIILGETVVSEGIDPYKGTNAWRVTRSGNIWNVFVGNREYRHIIDFVSHLTPIRELELVPAVPGGIAASVLDVMRVPVEESAMTEAEVHSALDLCSVGELDLTGIYSMLDYEQDDTYARLGGNYRVAVLPADVDDTFDLFYMKGARENAGHWNPGMKKGLLKTTPFSNVFDVEWCDAEGEWMRYDVQAEYDPLARTLTVKFPYQGSSIRFRKE
ncbi:MAG: hypothetical protein K2H22_05185, partial [Muribaculaceae bacterium]|nr:hypothetical protein [Muribaculaceae bacterium]